jgi:acylglycerol lipase
LFSPVHNRVPVSVSPRFAAKLLALFVLLFAFAHATSAQNFLAEPNGAPHAATAALALDLHAAEELPSRLLPYLANVTGDHGFVSANDGTCLFYRNWPAANSAEPRAVVLVLHGIGSHGGPYKVVADQLNAQGIAVYAIDARGHGLSCGPRDKFPATNIENQDIRGMLQFLREAHPNTKIFLLGDSMGGVQAMDYARTYSDDLAGLILVVPAIKVPFFKQLDTHRNAQLLPYLIFAPDAPSVSLTGFRLRQSCRDPKYIAERKTDPLAYDKVSIRYVKQIGAAARHWNTQIAPNITIPTLLLEGGKDPIVSHTASLTFFDRLASKDKTIKVYDGAPHTLLWDPQTPAVLATIGNWIAIH